MVSYTTTISTFSSQLQDAECRAVCWLWHGTYTQPLVPQRCATSSALILSDRNGHGCMLQYALLHLFGYKVTLDDLKDFRVCSNGLFLNVELTNADSCIRKSTVSLLDTQNVRIQRVLKLLPALLVKDSPMLLVSQLHKPTQQPYSTSLASNSSITTPFASLEMDVLWRVLPAKLLALLVIFNWGI